MNAVVIPKVIFDPGTRVLLRISLNNPPLICPSNQAPNKNRSHIFGALNGSARLELKSKVTAAKPIKTRLIPDFVFTPNFWAMRKV